MPASFDVFLCHNSRDKRTIRQIAEKLVDFGIRPWLDEWIIPPGRPWQQELEKNIDNIRTAAVFVGENGVGPWQNIQIYALLSKFLEENRPIIPVILADCQEPPELPLYLSQFAWVDFRINNPNPFKKLLWGINFEDPKPDYPDEKIRELSVALDVAYERRSELEKAGNSDLAVINERIVYLRRKIREGGILKAGDSLDNGRIKLLKPIGKGGFARVWKSYDKKRRTLVATKILHPHYAEDRTRRERFFRGARQMARLACKGVVHVIREECEDEGHYFFVMEFLSGGDFRQAVLNNQLPRRRRMEIILEIGKVLAYAHGKGIIHRDITPGNIVLDFKGKPKLTDFDLVRAPDTTGGTRTGMLGTFAYAAPELLDSARDSGASVDIYGLGMTSVFALNGKDLSSEVVRDSANFIGSLDIPVALQNVISKAVVWDKKDRWDSVESFCHALRRVLRDESIIPSMKAPRLDPSVEKVQASEYQVSRSDRMQEESESAQRVSLIEQNKRSSLWAILSTSPWKTLAFIAFILILITYFIEWRTPKLTPLTYEVTPNPTNNPRPQFSWQSAGCDAASFIIQISFSKNFDAQAIILEEDVGSEAIFRPYNDLPEGKLYWRVSCNKSSEILFSETRAFNLDRTPPPIPSELDQVETPTSNRRPKMGWKSDSEVDKYVIEIARDPEFSDRLFEIFTNSGFYEPQTDLPNGQICWRVASLDGVGNRSSFCDGLCYNIDTEPPDPPELIDIDNISVNYSPALSWYPASDAVEYVLQVADDPEYRNIVFEKIVDNNVNGDKFFRVETKNILNYDAVFYWRVASRDEAGNQTEFVEKSFVYDTIGPQNPKIIPVSGPTNNPRPTFDWGPMEGVIEYVVRVSRGREMKTIDIEMTLENPPFNVSEDLLAAGQEDYFTWCVIGIDEATNWSNCNKSKDTFYLDRRPLSGPKLNRVSSPTNDPMPVLAWQPVKEAKEYVVRIDRGEKIQAPFLLEKTVRDTSLTITENLLTDGHESYITWCVVSIDEAGNWSDCRESENTFRLDLRPLADPKLIRISSPTNNPHPALSWEPVKGAKKYIVRVDRGKNIQAPFLLEETVASSPFRIMERLLKTGEEDFISWCVISVDDANNWSRCSRSKNTFYLDLQPLSDPKLVRVPSPTNNPRPTLSWELVKDATKYIVRVDRGKDIQAPFLLEETVASSPFRITERLLKAGEEDFISWCVISVDSANNWSKCSRSKNIFYLDLRPSSDPKLVNIPSPTSDPRPVLSWETVQDAKKYVVRVSQGKDIRTPFLFEKTFMSAPFRITEDLLKDGPGDYITWCVISVDEADNWSDCNKSKNTFYLDLRPSSDPN